MINQDFQDYIKEESSNLFFSTLEDDFKTFLETKEDQLEKEFNEINNFQTNVKFYWTKEHFFGKPDIYLNDRKPE